MTLAWIIPATLLSGAGSVALAGAALLLILIGDGLHNFMDGIAIAAAFLTSVPLGIATTAAVVAHEIPQEIGDFFILLLRGIPSR